MAKRATALGIVCSFHELSSIKYGTEGKFVPFREDISEYQVTSNNNDEEAARFASARFT
jgi:hypothetical protein